MEQKKELFPLLEPVFLWLANSLEYYQFLVTHSTSLHLPKKSSSGKGGREGGDGGKEEDEDGSVGGEDEDEDDPINALYSVLVYAYQQAFYPVSKVCVCEREREREREKHVCYVSVATLITHYT